MNTWIKNSLYTFISIVSPSILVYLIFYGLPGSGNIVIEGTFLYVITIIGLILFYKFKPCSMWILPLGFALPVLICYVNDTLNDSEWFAYLSTILVMIYYSLPLILITIAIAFICTIRRNKGRWKHFYFRKLTLQEIEEWMKRKRGPLLSASVLILVFLSIAVIFSVSISRKYMVRRDIIQRINMFTEQGEECIFKLSEVTKFKWDKVVYFEYPVSEAEISREAGITYKRSTDLLEGFIFIYRGNVVYEDVVSIAPGNQQKAYLGFEGSQLTVLKEEDAVFKGRKESDTLYLIKPVVK